MEENSKSSMAKNMMWNTIGNIVYCVCQWVMTIAVVRLASYEEAGYFALAMSTSSTFSTISLFSMRNYQVSDINNEFSNNEYVGSHVITCSLAYLLCAINALGSTNMYQMLCIDAFMLIKIAESFVDVLHGVNQKYGRYDFIGKSCLIRGVVTVIGFVGGLIVLKNTYLSILITAALNLLIVVIYDWKHTNSLVKITPIIWNKNIKKLLLNCAPLVATNFLLSLVTLFPKTELQHILGTDILGKYSSIASPTLVVQIFASYAFNPMIPHISELYTRKHFEAFYSLLKKLLLFFAGFAVFIFIGGAIFGRLGLTILYGKDILDYYYVFFPLIGCTLMTAYVWIMISVVTAIRKIYSMLVAMGISIAIVWLLADKFITSFGINGTSYIQILGFAIFLIALLGITINTCKKEEKRMGENG